MHVYKYFVFRKDIFSLESPDLGRLNKLIVGHDNTWLGAGWYLDKVAYYFEFYTRDLGDSGNSIYLRRNKHEILICVCNM